MPPSAPLLAASGGGAPASGPWAVNECGIFSFGDIPRLRFTSLMPIPTKFDRTIAELDTMGTGLIVQLKIMQNAVDSSDKYYRDRLRKTLKERLQTFADGHGNGG
jgi:hypothetical protein